MQEISIARFSALQRAEIAEIYVGPSQLSGVVGCFSALQRAEIAEIARANLQPSRRFGGFSALQRAEIAEIEGVAVDQRLPIEFQCSSTSRNC